MEKITNLATLTVDEYYLLVEKSEGLSIKVKYQGCANVHYIQEKDEFFGGISNKLVEPIKYENGPCNNDIPYIYGFTDSDNQIYNIIDGNIPGISNSNRYQIYKYSFEIPIVSDIEIKCEWDKIADGYLQNAFFEFLKIQTQKVWSSNIKYGNISIPDAIKNGILTSKITSIKNGSPILSITQQELPNIISFIEEWYKLAEEVSADISIEDQQSWCVYRVVYDVDMLMNDTIIQPLPFSNTYNLDWVKRAWLGDNKCCLLKINIPPNTNMLVLEPPGEAMYQGRNSQYEITLPAGSLHKTNTVQDNNGLIITSYNFKPWTFEQCKEYISSPINRIRDRDGDDGYIAKRQRLGFSSVIVDGQIMHINQAVKFLSI